MRYDVDTEALHDDAASIGEVLALVQGLDIATELRPLVAGLPGGRVATGLGQVATAWEARLASMRWELSELGRCLAAAADTYDAVEHMARRAVQSAGGPA
jgi:hypothetical protein